MFSLVFKFFGLVPGIPEKSLILDSRGERENFSGEGVVREQRARCHAISSLAARVIFVDFFETKKSARKI